MVQWVRLHTPNAGGPGSFPGQGTRSHMHAATKNPHATTKKADAATKSPHAATKDRTKKIPHATTKTRHSLNK